MILSFSFKKTWKEAAKVWHMETEVSLWIAVSWFGDGRCKVKKMLSLIYFTIFFQEYIDQAKHHLHFIKIHAPWIVLSRMAEELNLRAPLQVRIPIFACHSWLFPPQALPNPPSNWSAKLLSWFCLPNPMAENVPNMPPDYYTAPFRSDKVDRWECTRYERSLRQW